MSAGFAIGRPVTRVAGMLNLKSFILKIALLPPKAAKHHDESLAGHLQCRRPGFCDGMILFSGPTTHTYCANHLSVAF